MISAQTREEWIKQRRQRYEELKRHQENVYRAGLLERLKDPDYRREYLLQCAVDGGPVLDQAIRDAYEAMTK